MSLFESGQQDARIALRGLRKSPGFALTALVTLAVGIGAASAMYTVVKAVLLAPLPYAAPEQRVMIWSAWKGVAKTWVSDAEILDYQRESRALAAVAGWGTTQQNLTGDGDAMRVGVGLVTANLFDVLGVRPLLGRTLGAEDDSPHAAPVVVLEHGFWRSRFGGDPGVIGRVITLNEVPVEVVGVMPEGFRLPTDFMTDGSAPTRLWRAMRIDPERLARESHGYHAAAVLAPGQTAAAASAELAAIARRLTEQGHYHEAMEFSAFAVPLDDEVRGDIRPAMWLLSGAVAFLLLIACANVANLLLIRGDGRLREIAVRTAMGAGPGRLVRQLLVEGLALSVGAAMLGLALAAAALQVLVTIDPMLLPQLAPLRLDAAVVAFTIVLACLTALLFGVAPALRTLRVDLVDTLRQGGQQMTAGASRLRLRRALVAIEVGLAVVLVIGAGLAVRSLGALGRVDLGFDPDNVLTLEIGLPAARFDTPEKVVDFYRQLNERVRAVAGVQHAGLVRALPLATTIGDWGLDVEGFEEAPGRMANGDWQVVSDGAFEAMRTRLASGRWFAPTDTTDAMPVAVVNESLARMYWPDGNAIGGRLRVGSDESRPWMTVVGIVADERHNGITELPRRKFYIPYTQWHLASERVVRNAFVVVRTSGDPLALAGPVRAAIRELDAHVPVSNVRSMREVVTTALATPRLTGFLLGTFAAIALMLAAVGIYGVLAYLVSQRTHEIGIRLAIGAGRGQMLRMVLAQGLTLAAVGLVAGLMAASLLARLMESVLYEVKPGDPATFAGVGLGLLLVAGVASAIPAIRATRVSPTTALRAE
jgi:putative ABC transport system permease protein